MMKKTVACGVLLSLLTLTACQVMPDSAANHQHQAAWVSQDLGLKQCEQASAKQALSTREQQLAQQQIQVLDAHCASDGMMRVQLCGSAQGTLGVFKIAASQLQKAQSLGFKAVQENQYQGIACS